jgi:hypothetical protein
VTALTEPTTSTLLVGGEATVHAPEPIEERIGGASGIVEMEQIPGVYVRGSGDGPGKVLRMAHGKQEASDPDVE